MSTPKKYTDQPTISAITANDILLIVDAETNTTRQIQWSDIQAQTANIADDSVTAAKMQHGVVRNRQGGTTGDATWITGGSSNTDTSSKSVFIQVGSVTGTTGTVTFPTAFSYPPLVFVSVMTAGSQNVWARAKDVTATNFAWQIFINTTTNGTSETVSWLAIGQ